MIDDDDSVPPRRRPVMDVAELRRLFREARDSLSEEIERSRRMLASVSETLARANHALAHARGEVPAEPTAKPARAPRARRILIVEDNEDAARFLQRGLTAVGHLVEVVHTPSAAVLVAKYFAPDVALLDIGLPEVDGWKLAEHLRTEARPMHMIAVTGYSRDIDRERSRQAGFIEHLLKPVDIRYLARMVGQLAPAA